VSKRLLEGKTPSTRLPEPGPMSGSTPEGN
jgi:hypothetical protein